METQEIDVNFEAVKHRKISMSVSITLEDYKFIKENNISQSDIFNEKLQEIKNGQLNR